MGSELHSENDVHWRIIHVGYSENDCDVTGIKSMFLPKSVTLSGLNLVERYPYETVRRDYDYVRLASITAGKFNGLH